jgi:hypothetical protein
MQHEIDIERLGRAIERADRVMAPRRAPQIEHEILPRLPFHFGKVRRGDPLPRPRRSAEG